MRERSTPHIYTLVGGPVTRSFRGPSGRNEHQPSPHLCAHSHAQLAAISRAIASVIIRRRDRSTMRSSRRWPFSANSRSPASPASSTGVLGAELKHAERTRARGTGGSFSSPGGLASLPFIKRERSGHPPGPGTKHNTRHPSSPSYEHRTGSPVGLP
jgi:hypothetical protein